MILPSISQDTNQMPYKLVTFHLTHINLHHVAWGGQNHGFVVFFFFPSRLYLYSGCKICWKPGKRHSQICFSLPACSVQ